MEYFLVGLTVFAGGMALLGCCTSLWLPLLLGNNLEPKRYGTLVGITALWVIAFALLQGL